MAQIDIGGRLHSTATGNVVAGANEVLDDILNKKQNEVNNISINQTYRKSETYNKDEVNSLFTTPNQEFVSVTATSETTAATDILPAEGEKNTIYRVGNWDGTEYTTGCYTEYAWDGSDYVLLSTKEPGIDGEPTLNSDNLVKSGGVAGVTDKLTNTNYLLAGCKKNVFDKSYVRAGKGIRNVDETYHGEIIDDANGCITCYYAIPNEADILHVEGAVTSGNYPLKFRITSLPVDDDVNVRVLVIPDTGKLDVDLVSLRNSYPNLKYFCCNVYRGGETSALNTMSIVFENLEETTFKNTVDNLQREVPKEVSCEIIANWIKGAIDAEGPRPGAGSAYYMSDYLRVYPGHKYNVRVSGGSSAAYVVTFYSGAKAWANLMEDYTILGNGNVQNLIVTAPDVPVGAENDELYIRIVKNEDIEYSGVYGISSIGELNSKVSDLNDEVEEIDGVLNGTNGKIYLSTVFSENGPILFSNGQTSVSTGYRHTTMIKVSTGQIVTYKGGGSANAAVIAAYTDNSRDTYVQECSIAGTNQESGQYVIYADYVVPAGIHYLSFCASYNDEHFSECVIEISDSEGLVKRFDNVEKNVADVKVSVDNIIQKLDVTWGYGFITAEARTVGDVEYAANDIVPASPSSTSYLVSDEIDVSEGDCYIVGIYGSMQGVGVLFYEEQDDSHVPQNDTRILNNNGYQQLMVVVPKDAVAMRISARPSSDLKRAEHDYNLYLCGSVIKKIYEDIGSSDGEAEVHDSYIAAMTKYDVDASNKKPCISFAFDCNASSMYGEGIFEFAERLIKIGLHPSYFPLDTQLESSDAVNRLKKLRNMGCEIAVHSVPADGFGRGNVADEIKKHIDENTGYTSYDPSGTLGDGYQDYGVPVTVESLETKLKERILPNVLKNGFAPVGWTTSRGVIYSGGTFRWDWDGVKNARSITYPAVDLVPVLKKYFIHGITSATGAYDPTWDAESGERKNDGFNPAYLNNENVDPIAMKRWGTEVTFPTKNDIDGWIIDEYATQEEKDYLENLDKDSEEYTEEFNRLATKYKTDERIGLASAAILKDREDNVIKSVKKAIDMLVAEGGYLVLYAHHYVDTGVKPNTEAGYGYTGYTLTKRVMDAILDYLSPYVLGGQVLGGTNADMVKYCYGLG